MKQLTLLLIGLFISLISFAGEVTEAEALQKAQQFMQGKQFKQRNLRRAPSVDAKNNAYYVFNVEDNGGFVIVSGDDRTSAILGYGNSGNLDTRNLPDNLKWWLSTYTKQIAALDASLEPVASTARRSSKAAILPLITAKWNQGTPYNYMCPDGNYVDYDEKDYDTENRCVTGCVATAMAQVMYYWQWPKSCPALDSYMTSGHTIKALPATTFDYEKMTDTYKRNQTGEAANEVAKLMRYCGQAVQMAYGVDASSANVTSQTLSSIFQYSKNVRYLSRNGYTTTQWETIVYDELAAKRPVLYSGRTETDGHQFIIDGYDGNGFFHINWGWGGSPDSYYVLSIADPGAEQGYGGSEGAFQYGQDALIGVEPAKDGEISLPKMSSRISSSIEPVNYSRKNQLENFIGVSLNGMISVDYNSMPESTLDAEIGWALYKDDVLKEVVGSQSVTIPVSLSERYTNNMSVVFGERRSKGTFQLCQVYRFDGETEWTRCYNYDNCLIAVVTSTTLTVRLANTDFVSNGIITSDYPEVNSPVEVKLNVTNNGESTNQIFKLYMQKGSSWTKVAQAPCRVDPGMSGDVVWSFTPTYAGSYNLKVTVGDSEDALETATVSVASTVQTTVVGLTYLCTPDYGRARVISTNTSNTSLTVQAVVTANGKSCKVLAIDDHAFYMKSDLTSVSLPEGLESIGNNAFTQCHGIKEMKLPSTLKTIGKSAFYNCLGLKSIVIPASVESIGSSAFAEMYYLTTVTSLIEEPFAVADNTFMMSQWNSETEDYDVLPSPATLYVPIGTRSKYEALSGWTQFAGIEEGEPKEAIVDGLKYFYTTGSTTATVIQDDSYESLTEVDIPPTVSIDGKDYTVTAIGDNAFRSCHSISEVTLPNTLKTIGASAFWNCNSIESITIPASVESIGSSAFAYMGSLTTVISQINEPFAISDDTFEAWDSPIPATLRVPIGTKAKYEALSGWTQFSAIEEGERKEAMLNGLMYSYSTGSTTATVIKDNSYKSLTAVKIPATVNFDGKDYSVTAIGENAFVQCQKVKEVTLPNTLKTIGNDAFWNCNHIESIMIPASVESIGEEAFQYMFGLKTVVSRITEPFAIGDDTFDWGGSPSDATLYVPYGTKAKYEALSGWTVFSAIEESPKSADADGDGSIDVNDVTSTINYILNKPVEKLFFEAADVDEDGVIDVNDVQGIIDKALGR